MSASKVNQLPCKGKFTKEVKSLNLCPCTAGKRLTILETFCLHWKKTINENGTWSCSCGAVNG